MNVRSVLIIVALPSAAFVAVAAALTAMLCSLPSFECRLGVDVSAPAAALMILGAMFVLAALLTLLFHLVAHKLAAPTAWWSLAVSYAAMISLPYLLLYWVGAGHGESVTLVLARVVIAGVIAGMTYAYVWRRRSSG